MSAWHFKQLATNIRDNAEKKCAYYLRRWIALFVELDRLGDAKKAIIFTESERTWNYLLNLLADTTYGGGIVLFNGTNSDTVRRLSTRIGLSAIKALTE